MALEQRTEVEKDPHEGSWGSRAVSDFEYEFQLAAANRFINNEIEMVFFMANSENNFISSSMIKEMALAGQDVSSLVPQMVTKYLKEKVKQ